MLNKRITKSFPNDLGPIQTLYNVEYTRADGTYVGSVSWYYKPAWNGTRYQDTGIRQLFSWTTRGRQGFRVYDGVRFSR